MRGNVFRRVDCLHCVGITPAYAGKSTPDRLFLYHLGDHPRVCGEKNGICRAKVPHLGSPPRMRGKASQYATSRPAARITPAYAGKRPTAKGCSSGSRDYPRVCGEKSLERFRSGLGLGSPPRMRGKGGGLPRPRFGGGITPAYAGKRRRTPTQPRKPRDHPRVCGEKISSRTSHILTIGSPPRVRGKEREQPHL